MRIGKIVSGAYYRMDKKFQNSPILGISMLFRIEKILAIC